MKGSLFASLTLAWVELPCTLAPNLNFLLLIQLELSVKQMLARSATPFLNVNVRSPVTNGLLPSLARMTQASNSFLVQSSPLEAVKSPLRTTISIFVDDIGPDVIICLELVSTKAIFIGSQSSDSTLLLVKKVEGILLKKYNCQAHVPDDSVWLIDDLQQLN